MSPSIQIAAPETCAKIRQLANLLGTTLVGATDLAVGNELARRNAEPTAAASSKPTDLVELLNEEMRSKTREYCREVAKHLNERVKSTRVWQMMARRGPVGTLERLIAIGPSTGLKYCVEMDRLDLSAEMIALDPRFAEIISEATRARARANLLAVGVNLD